MALSLDTINQKIKDLEQKKQDLERRDSEKLYKSIQSILGKEFSSALVTHIISESWKVASSDQKDRWLKAAQSFPKSKSANKANSKSNHEIEASVPKAI